MQRTSAITLIAALAAGAPAPAQDQTADSGDAAQQDAEADAAADTADATLMAQDGRVASGEIIPLGPWHRDVFSGIDGTSLRDLTDSPALSETGTEIGEIEDVILSPEGEVLSVIAEVGGVWDIADTHVNVPWSEVSISGEAGDYEIRVPITEDTLANYALFADNALAEADVAEEVVPGVDSAEPPARAWRASELMGDYARLTGGEDDTPVPYGYVTDIIVEDAQVQATVVTPSGTYRGGYYAYPSYANPMWNWRPGSPYYDLPYTVDEAQGAAPMDQSAEG